MSSLPVQGFLLLWTFRAGFVGGPINHDKRVGGQEKQREEFLKARGQSDVSLVTQPSQLDLTELEQEVRP